MLHWFYFLTANNLLNLALITARKCSEKIIFFLFNFDMKQNHTFVSSLAQIFLCNIFTTIFSKEHLFKIGEFIRNLVFQKRCTFPALFLFMFTALPIPFALKPVHLFATSKTRFGTICFWQGFWLHWSMYSPVTRYICYMGLVLNFL